MAAVPIVGSRVGSLVGALINTDSDIGAFPASLVVGLIGDSDAVGFGTASGADFGFGLTSNAGSVSVPISAVQYNDQFANSANTPIGWVYVPGFLSFGALQPYDIPGNQSIGQEMTLGQELLKLTSAPAIIKSAITGTTLATHWLPTGTFPVAGNGNLYHTYVANVHNFERQVGRNLDAMVVVLGTNDGVSPTDAGNFQANMAALAAALRTDFNASLKIIWVKCNPNVPNANIGTVITAQQTVDTADNNMLLVDYDDCPLSGSFHCTSNGYLSVGQRSSTRVRQLVGLSALAAPVTPRVVGYGPAALGTGNLTALSWGDAQNGDLEVMDVVCGLVVGTITTPAGWTLVVDSGDSTAIGVHEHRSVYTRPVTTALLNANNSHMPSTAITITTSTRNAAKVYCVRGPNLNPTVDASSVFVSNAISTGPTSITGVTTIATNDLVLLFAGGYCGSDGLMTVTNGGLTNVIKVQDTAANINTDREILTCVAGNKVTAGATGSWSASSTANMILACVTVAIKP